MKLLTKAWVVCLILSGILVTANIIMGATALLAGGAVMFAIDILTDKGGEE